MTDPVRAAPTGIVVALPPVTPGWATTEWWGHLIVPVVAILAVFGVVVPPEWVTCSLAVAAGAGSVGYSLSRARVKAAALDAAARVANLHLDG